MHSPNIFTEISIIVALATGMAALMRLLKQPLLIGYIITGILVGPVLQVVQEPQTLESFSKIGIALLLFIVGLGLNPKMVRDLGKVSLFTGFLQMFVMTSAGLLISLFVGRTFVEGLIIGASLSFSSTIVGLKLLTDKREQTRLYGKLAIGVLLVQDVVATTALLILSTQEGGFSFTNVAELFGKGLLLGIPLYLISTKVLPRLTRFTSASTEFLFLFAIAWGFGVASLFDLAGFSLEIGALIAGVCLASMKYAQEASARLRPVRDFFIVIFFVFLGVNLRLEDMISQLPLALLFSVIILILNPIAIMISLGLNGHTKRNSFKVGVLLAQISEFSLIFVVLAKSLNLVPQEVVSLITLTGLITIAFSCYAIIYDDELFDFLSRHVKLFEVTRQDKKDRKLTFDIIQFGYEKGGSELVKTYASMPRKSFVVVDYNPDVITLLEDKKIHYIYGDASDIELLDELDVASAKLIVSTLTHFATTKFLIEYIVGQNPNSVVILHADNAEEAAELYGLGASYVMVPHYVGSERLSSFIARHGLKKKEFEKFKERHLAQLRSHYELTPPEETEDTES